MEKFKNIAAELFHISPDEVNGSLTPKDIAGWDSMNYLLFISELEKQFDVSFTMDEVLGAQSLGDIERILTAKGVLS